MKKNTDLVFIFIILTVFSGCKMKDPVDLMVVHGNIYSVDSVNSSYEAMALREGKIVALGTSSELEKRYKAAQVLDAAGMTILPGFIDAHSHFLGFALNQQNVDLTGARSMDEILERLKKSSDTLPGFWLTGRGWDQNLWDIKEFPDRSELDKLFPDRPVVLVRIDGHSVLCNEKALSLADIGAVNNFKPGEVEIKQGKLTGILSENAADYMRNSIPLPDRQSKQRLLREAEKQCFSVGLTMVTDAGLEYADIRLMDSLQQSGLLKMRIYAMVSPTSENLNGFVFHGPYETERLTVRSIKLYTDGSLGSRTALMKSPYQDAPEKSGILVTSPDTIRKFCTLAYKNGYQVNTHAIGDSAIRLILEIYASYLKGKNDLRWRVEHAQVVDPADFHFFSDYSIIPSVQATHATSDMVWAIDRLGQERLRGAYAYKELLKQNGWLPNGTDFPIENISPLFTFYAAVSRKNLNGYPENGFQMENALTREEALRSITLWAAKAGFMEDRCGSLEVGKNGDFVILAKDIMTEPIAGIPDIKIVQTYIQGERVY